MVIKWLCYSLHFSQLSNRASSSVEKVKFIEWPGQLVALLCDLEVTQLQRRLCQPVEVVFLFQLLSRLERHLNVPTRQRQIEPLSYIFFKEECDFWVALLFQVADYRVATQVASAEDFFHFSEIFLL